ncbi:MAG: HigA family addiction module antitoxin [Elainellaceae cyanobacterium]
MNTPTLLTDTDLEEAMKYTVSAAEIIREDYMEPLGLSGAELARRIGVSPSTVNRMLNESSSLTAELAVKICAVVGGSPAVLMRIETEHRLALAEKSVDVSKLERIESDDRELAIA